MSEEIPNLPAAIIEIGRVRVPAGAVRIKYSRSSGPGGQNVNKTASRCEIWVPVTAIEGLTYNAAVRLRAAAGSKLTLLDEVHIAAEESRSQEGNRSFAIDRLREMLVKAMVEPKRRRKTKPSYGSTQRRLSAKKRRGDIKKNRGGNESNF